MSKNDYEEILSAKEKQFNNFLNKTIILNAKDYFRINNKKEKRELNILDDENFENEVSKYTENSETLSFGNNVSDFIELIENVELCLALKSLTAAEQKVIFLLFEKGLLQKEVANEINIYSKSISKIKNRALRKLRKFLKGGNLIWMVIHFLN